MGHHDRIWPSGLVDGTSNALGAEFEQLDTNQYGSIDGDTGGVWTPTTPVRIHGKGISRTHESGVLDNFAADGGGVRTFRRVGSFLPASRIFSGSSSLDTSGIVSGGGVGEAVSTILKIPHLATLVTVDLFFVVASHVSLPAVGPGLSLQKVNPSDSPPSLTTFLNASDPILFPLPGTVLAYEAGGATQVVSYNCTQNNVADREDDYFVVTALDEAGGGHVAGNLLTGWAATFFLSEDSIIE